MVLGLLALAMFRQSAATVRMKIERDGQTIGFATLNQNLTEQGGKIVKEEILLGKEPLLTRVVVTSAYDSKGKPVRKEQVTSRKEGKRSVVATFDDTGAHLTITEGTQVKNRNVRIASGASRAIVSEFWVWRDMPSAGASNRAYAFDMTRQEWSPLEAHYLGTTSITIDGKAHAGYKIHSSLSEHESDYVLDEKGLPLLIEDDSGTRMVRLP